MSILRCDNCLTCQTTEIARSYHSHFLLSTRAPRNPCIAPILGPELVSQIMIADSPYWPAAHRPFHKIAWLALFVIGNCPCGIAEMFFFGRQKFFETVFV